MSVAWSCDRIEDDEPRVRLHRVTRGGAPASVAEVVRAFRDEPAWREVFRDCLARQPFEAFFWETPVAVVDALERRFEFAVIDSVQLARMPADPTAFREHLTGEAPVVTFENLGRDATLVVPRPRGGEGYAHLAGFVRSAPASTFHALWIAVGEAMSATVARRPVWLNTAGLGVPWLHVRLDSRPKYYRHAPYRAAPAGGADGPDRSNPRGGQR